MENGLVHRIESRNAFIACVHNHGTDDLVVFLICERCGAVGEASSAAVAQTLKTAARAAGFTPKAPVIEIGGVCAHCRERSNSQSLSCRNTTRRRLVRPRRSMPSRPRIVVVLCMSWGFNQVAVKLALPDIPPLMQATIRSVGAAVLVALWTRWRGIPLDLRDGTLLPGLDRRRAVRARIRLDLSRAAVDHGEPRRAVHLPRAVLVVIGSRWLLPGDRFRPSQWLGLALSFAGIAVAFGVPTPAADPRQMIGDVMLFCAGDRLGRHHAGHQGERAQPRAVREDLALSARGLGADPGARRRSRSASGSRARPRRWRSASLAYQTLWVVSITFVIWFALIQRYSASRLSAFTFLTPLFGVAAGHLVLGEPLTPAFAAAVALVVGGLVLVNRPR